MNKIVLITEDLKNIIENMFTNVDGEVLNIKNKRLKI